MVVAGDGKRTLDRFCSWTLDHRAQDSHHKKTFDVALYVTRQNFGPAGALGLCIVAAHFTVR